MATDPDYSDLSFNGRGQSGGRRAAPAFPAPRRRAEHLVALEKHPPRIKALQPRRHLAQSSLGPKSAHELPSRARDLIQPTKGRATPPTISLALSQVYCPSGRGPLTPPLAARRGDNAVPVSEFSLRR